MIKIPRNIRPIIPPDTEVNTTKNKATKLKTGTINEAIVARNERLKTGINFLG